MEIHHGSDSLEAHLEPDLLLVDADEIPLEPFQDVDAIIELYIHYQAIHNPSLSWPPKSIEQIKTVSEQDFWLLNYALQGYVKANGQGKQESWIKTGVTEDLRNLKNCGDIHAAQYPQIVVSLSPLYMNEVMTAENAFEGMEILQRERPTVIVTDIRMPKMDGIEFMRRAKAMDGDVEIIVITGHGDMDVAIEALRLGAVDFLLKPVDIEDLQKAINCALDKLATKASCLGFIDHVVPDKPIGEI